MGCGLSKSDAIKQVKEDNESKLNCYSCGEELKKSPTGPAYFCTKNIRCRQARNRMKYLMYSPHHRLTKETALKEVLDSL